jgi:hypothetical protein
MGTAINRIGLCGGAVLALVLFVPMVGLSQQPESNPAPDPGAAIADGQNANAASPYDQQQPNPAGTSGFLVRALNSADALTGEDSPLHWGWVSVRSAAYQQYFSHLDFPNPGGPSQSENINGAILSTAIVVDHPFGGSSHFTLQYTPSLIISSGNVYPNALNQTAGVDTSFQLNDRWGLQITDRFSYNGSQRTFVGLPFETNAATGLTVSQNYLTGPGTVLFNIAVAAFSYGWSPLTTVTFSTSLGYQYGAGTGPTGGNINSLSQGGEVLVSHLLSPTQSIGFSYSGRYADFANTSKIAGPQSNSFLQDALVTYSLQYNSWSIHLGVGLTNNIGGDSGTGLGVSGGISKNFHRSNLAAVFSRGHQFNGFVTSSFSNNAGVSHSIYWTPRLSTSTAGYYSRTPGAYPSAQSSWYAIEQLNFGLTRQVSLNGSFGYTDQVGDGVYVLTSNRRFAAIGITWSAHQPTRP